jgi:phage-related tail protein
VIRALLSQSIATAIANSLKGASGLLGLLAVPLAAAAGKGVAALFQAIVPSFASGGIMPYSGVALVGEQGPELVKLPKGSQVINNSQTEKMLGGGAQGVRVEVYGTLRGSDIYIANKEEGRKRGNITG